MPDIDAIRKPLAETAGERLSRQHSERMAELVTSLSGVLGERIADLLRPAADQIGAALGCAFQPPAEEIGPEHTVRSTPCPN